MASGNADWELEEGLPQLEDPFIQQYLKGRDALIAEEQKRRHDATYRKSLSPIAARACKIVSQIRAREQGEVWTTGMDSTIAHEADEILYPGVMFHHAKGRMEKTNLWKIVEKMPKGSLLHAHMDAMFDIDFLIDQAFSTPGIHILAPKALVSSQDLEKGPVFFQFSSQSPAETEKRASIWSEGYEPSALIPIKTAASSFPNGGEAGFRDWLRSRCMLMPEHSYHHHHGVDAIWTIFTTTFPVINSILMYEPIFRACFRRMLGQLADDGIRYVEFRIAFVFAWRKEGKDQPEDGYDDWCRTVEEEVERFKKTEQGKSFYEARIIWTTIRRFGNKEIVDTMKKCIETKHAFPDLICGFDLVGQEDLGRPLKDLVPVLFWFRKRCAEEGVDIPFFFHAGECLGDGDETDHNLFDAILLGTRRIGHGFSLYKHPLLIDLVKEKKIMVECCPISNEILRLASSIKSHPLPALLSRGVAVSLCNDDPAILGHGKNGLTHDFWQALQGLQNVDLAGLAMMVQNSIRWSCYEDQSTGEWKHDVEQGILGEGLKAARLREWHTEFEKFCEWVVLEFAEFDEED
ncbi:Adenosine deaminase CECR1-A [Penicillium rolfsii]|nr:Adenosine deaminase CECR1-A [Penicillium rolfsii]